VVGDFAVHELLRWAPDAAIEVRWHGDLPAARRARLAAACERAGVPSRRDDAAVTEKRSKGSAQVLAVFAKRDARLAPDRDHLILIEPRDPGNLGALQRTALAFGVEDLAVVGDADPWSPHVTRAAAGATFALRIAPFDDLAGYRTAWPAHDLVLLDGSGATPLSAFQPAAPQVALAAGPEWPGLRDAERALGRTVRIEHDPRVESLNVTVAVGIALQRLATTRPTGRRAGAGGRG
jgi:tRNA G18 (ribose-2'-O)-methylase SpoU